MEDMHEANGTFDPNLHSFIDSIINPELKESFRLFLNDPSMEFKNRSADFYTNETPEHLVYELLQGLLFYGFSPIGEVDVKTSKSGKQYCSIESPLLESKLLLFNTKSNTSSREFSVSLMIESEDGLKSAGKIRQLFQNSNIISTSTTTQDTIGEGILFLPKFSLPTRIRIIPKNTPILKLTMPSGYQLYSIIPEAKNSRSISIRSFPRHGESADSTKTCRVNEGSSMSALDIYSSTSLNRETHVSKRKERFTKLLPSFFPGASAEYTTVSSATLIFASAATSISNGLVSPATLALQTELNHYPKLAEQFYKKFSLLSEYQNFRYLLENHSKFFDSNLTTGKSLDSTKKQVSNLCLTALLANSVITAEDVIEFQNTTLTYKEFEMFSIQDLKELNGVSKSSKKVQAIKF